MSDTYFCFSDECGDYKPHMNDDRIKIHPFYLRTTLIINSSEWRFFNNQFKELKTKYGILITQELKWAYLWSLRNFKKKGKTIPDKHELKYFESFDYHKLIDFVEESLTLITKLKEKRIIATYTSNDYKYGTNEKSILGFHLQEHMQRIEMQLQVDEDNLGVLFFDPVSTEKNEMFRKIYNELFENGDFVEKYKFIKDSLNIENSHQSVGIQIADYISGAFSSLLKASSSNNGYSRGVKMFFDSIYPNLCKGRNGAIQGYGIREVPRNNHARNWLTQKTNSFKI